MSLSVAWLSIHPSVICLLVCLWWVWQHTNPQPISAAFILGSTYHSLPVCAWCWPVWVFLSIRPQLSSFQIWPGWSREPGMGVNLSSEAFTVEGFVRSRLSWQTLVKVSSSEALDCINRCGLINDLIHSNWKQRTLKMLTPVNSTSAQNTLFEFELPHSPIISVAPGSAVAVINGA